MAVAPSIGRASRVERSPAPEASATHDLYERYAGQVFGFCLHRLGSREEAEDAVQSTFLNAFRGLQRGVVPEQEAAWLFKIAQNVCLSRRRSSWRRGRIESPADFELVQELTPAPSRRGDELMGLQDVLEAMPESQRRAILLREWQGLSYREIADELELSQGAVETLIFRARRSLAQGLEEPPEPQRARRRTRRGLDLGSLVAGLKSLLLGGVGAAKVAATVAVVGGATVAAGVPVEHHLARIHRAPAAVPAVVKPAASRPVPARPASPPAVPAARPAAHPVVRRRTTRSHPSGGGTKRAPVAEQQPAPPAAPLSAAPVQPSTAPSEPAHRSTRGGDGVRAAPPSHGGWRKAPPPDQPGGGGSSTGGGDNGGAPGSGGSGDSSGMHGAPPVEPLPSPQPTQDQPTPTTDPAPTGSDASSGGSGPGSDDGARAHDVGGSGR